jgi:hypothetical protein
VTAHKRIEITIETDRVLVIRRHRSIRAWCQECGGEVDMVSQAEVQALTGLPRLVLRDSTQALRWHVAESQDEAPLVCLDSLLRSLQGPDSQQQKWRIGELKDFDQ